jgi:hypothetical protein
LLSNSTEKYALVKLLLERGAPLFARNHNDETCFEIIQQKRSSLLRNIHIGRHLSLKQISANTAKRSELNTEILPAELKTMLTIY